PVTPLPPPPSSTRFPYTTLFRSDDLVEEGAEVRARPRGAQPVEEGDADEHGQGDQADEPQPEERQADLRQKRQKHHDTGEDGDRSEEHTSELQSRFDLVCRLLLE